MTIKTKSRILNVSLFLRRDGAPAIPHSVTSPVLGNFRPDHNGSIPMSDEEADGLIRFWEAECDAVNDGDEGYILSALTADEIDAGDAWVFDVKEEM